MDPQMKARAEALILGAGCSYGLSSSKSARDEVQRALADDEYGPAFAEWAILHLGADNLLTADEMALYAALDKNGEVDRLASLYDLEEVQTVTEDDISSAIEELNRSTDAISKQTETLKLQQDAVSRLIKKAADSDTRRQDFELVRQRRSKAEQQYVAAEVEGLSQGLEIQLSDLEQQVKDSGANINETVDSLLSSDDKLLSSLQNLGYELEQQDPGDRQTIERLREICMRLIKHTVETIRTKLDRVYLEALVDAERSGQVKPATEAEVKALQEEVESLYSEILPVAQMSVEQQHLEPAMKSISARSGQSLSHSAAAVTYINKCLDYLLDRSERLRNTIDTLRSHQTASASLISTAKTELSAPVGPPQRPSKPAMPVSPVRIASPIRPRTNTANSRARRRSSGIPDDPPIETLLHQLAIFMEDGTPNSYKIAALTTALDDRSVKANDVARNAQDSFEAIASAHLDDVRRAVQLLTDSLLAESPFGDVELVDPEIKGSIDVLVREVQHIKDGLGRAESEKRSGRSEKKAEILRRWGV